MQVKASNHHDVTGFLQLEASATKVFWHSEIIRKLAPNGSQASTSITRRLAGVQESNFNSWEDTPLFDPGPKQPPEKKTKAQKKPVWSESKAQFISTYLRFFVYITHNGTYIDAFAGPQTDRSDQAWTAQLVLESEPKGFHKFYLFDESAKQVDLLRQLATDHGDRTIQIFQGDCNSTLPHALPIGSIREGEASFCLLDQRTFECEWNLCQHIAQLRRGSRKVEQFYFLANDWLPRAFASITTLEGYKRLFSMKLGPG